MSIVKCSKCEKEINLDTDAQTFCSECKKDFCFSIGSPCFVEYHRQEKLYHNALSVINPAWEINIRHTHE